MIVLLHGAPAYGAVERYVAAIARGLGDRGLLVHPGVPELDRLGVRTTVLRTEEGSAVMVPNAILFAEIILNRGAAPPEPPKEPEEPSPV